MKEMKPITIDECMRDVNALIEYFRRNAKQTQGNASPAANECRHYAESLIMARDALKTKYYGIP